VLAATILKTLIPPAKSAGVTLDLILVKKGTPGSAESQTLLDFAMAQAGKRSVAGLPKLKQSGRLHDAFQAQLKSSGLEIADASLPLALVLSIHDKLAALQNAKKSGFLTSSVMNTTQKRIEADVDGRKSVKHSALSEAISQMINNPSTCGIKLKPDSCDIAYLPVVQSGGSFNLRVGAESDDSRLHDDVVLVHFGSKYNHECSNICRTLFFNPDTQCVPTVPCTMRHTKKHPRGWGTWGGMC
jgi:nucleosome binding factor SPN SPT16 subunit